MTSVQTTDNIQLGPQGASGPTGTQGPSGPQGASGPQGTQGNSGPRGIQGIQGIQGNQGNQGITGTVGANYSTDAGQSIFTIDETNGNTMIDGTLVVNGTTSCGVIQSSSGKSKITLSDSTNGDVSFQLNGSGKVVLPKVDINGGSMDGTIIGSETPNAGKFTTVSVNGLTDTGTTNLSNAVITKTDINGGTIDGTTIGATNSTTGKFTTLVSSGSVNVNGLTDSGTTTLASADINGGTVDGTTIGATSATTAKFTTINATGDINVESTGKIVCSTLEGNASSATTVGISTNSVNDTKYIGFVGAATTGNQPVLVNAGLQYNSGNNVLTVGTLYGNAVTASKLQTAVNIGGVSFDGSTNIDLPGVNTYGNQDTSGSAAKIDITNPTTDSTSDHYITFVGNSTSGSKQAVNVNSELKYNPHTDTLTAGIFSGDITGTATKVTVADESTVADCYPLFVTSATGDLPPKLGANLKFNSISGELTANLIGTATNVTGIVAIGNGGTGATTATAAASAIGLGTEDSPQFTSLELGHASDTTLTRASAGVVKIEGNVIRTGTVAIGNGGTGATTASAARTNLVVDEAGTDNSTPVTLATVSSNYLTLSGQAVIAGTVPVVLGGTGAINTTAAAIALTVAPTIYTSGTTITCSVGVSYIIDIAPPFSTPTLTLPIPTDSGQLVTIYAVTEYSLNNGNSLTSVISANTLTICSSTSSGAGNWKVYTFVYTASNEVTF